MQRGALVDTALYVVISAGLNGSVGVVILLLLGQLNKCSIIKSAFFEIYGLHSIGTCSISTDICYFLVYCFALCVVAFFLGRKVSKVIMRSRVIFQAVYGPYFEIFENAPAFVVADVMTTTQHEGRILLYEGQLVELSLNGSRKINFVCLEGAARFYLDMKEGVSETTDRDKFQKIDKNSRIQSRITIQGEEITNILTRTYAFSITEPHQIPNWIVKNMASVWTISKSDQQA